MREHVTPEVVRLVQLTKPYAQAHAVRLAELANEIASTNWSTENILLDELADRPLPGKWDYSLVLAEGDRPFALVIAAERRGEGVGVFAKDSIHLSALACDPKYRGQGYGRRLLREFLAGGLLRGYVQNKGPLTFSLVTSAASNNQFVRKLYEAHGFRVVGKKPGDEKQVVMRATAAEVAAALAKVR